MEILRYGLDFGHKRGEFCPRLTFDYYFLTRFITDYVAEIDGLAVEGKAGDYLLIEPGKVIYHGPRQDAKDGFRNDWIYIGGTDFKALLDKYPIPKNCPFRIPSPHCLSLAIEKIHTEISNERSGYEDKCNVIITDTVIDMFRMYEREIHSYAKDKIEECRHTVMKSYSKDWTLLDMADLAGYSVSRFSALYKAKYGISPMNDLIDRRIDEAKRLMIYGGISLSEISERVGFSSLYYFSRCFKSREGISPTEAKKKYSLYTEDGKI